VLLIGHRNRSGKTHKLDQLLVEERKRLPSQARDDNATPHFMPSRSPSRCLSFLLSWNLYFIFAWNFSSLVEHAHMTDRGDVTVYRGSGSGGCTIFRSVADQGSRKCLVQNCPSPRSFTTCALKTPSHGGRSRRKINSRDLFTFSYKFNTDIPMSETQGVCRAYTLYELVGVLPCSFQMI